MADPAVLSWFLRSALGGGLLLLVCWLWQRRLRSPARQQRLGEWAVAAALVVALASALPAWLLIPVPAPSAPAAVVAPTVPEAALLPAPPELPPGGLAFVAVEPLPEAPPAPAPAPPLAEASPAPRPAWPAWWANLRWIDGVILVYAGLAVVVLARWLLANLAIAWLLRGPRPTPPDLVELFAEMAWPRRCRLIVSDRVRVPFSVGLWRPAVVLPGSLVDSATLEELRWVLAHELSHLNRQDTRTCWLFALGQVFYFYLPWFWWLRREVRLSQEYIADAEAAGWAGSPADYAQFLVSWAGRPMSAVMGVSASGSDLFRRVEMLLQDPKPCQTRVSRRWVMAVASSLVAVGLVAGGLGLRVVAAEDNKPEPKKAEKPAAPKKEGQRDTRPENRGGLFDPFADDPNDEVLKQMRQQMQQAQQQLEMMRRQLGGGMRVVVPGGADIVFPGGRVTIGGRQRPTRLGVQMSVPSKTLVDQLELPKDQGIVLEEVGPNSAAGKAGLKSHDILLELGGKTVPSNPEAFRAMVEAVEANKAIDAVVLRRGKKETIKGLTLPEVKAAADTNPNPNIDVVVPNLPAFPNLQGLARLRARAGAAAGGNAAGTVSISRQNDDFTAKQRVNGLSITVKGTIDQGKGKVSEVVIDEGKGQSTTYSSLDKVPSTHKDRVKKLVEMSVTGSVQIQE